MRRGFGLSIIALLLASVLGCGYSVHRKALLPYQQVVIDRIENRTLEPGLQDILYRVLVEELSKQGITVVSGASHRLSGVIKTYDIPGISEKGGVVREYQVTVKADFVLISSDGSKREIKDLASPFIEPFQGADDMGMLIGAKGAATERALRDLARQLSGALFHK